MGPLLRWIILAFTSLCCAEASTCPGYYPICDNYFDCTISGASSPWSRAPTANTPADTRYNYISGYDNAGSNCEKDFQASDLRETAKIDWMKNAREGEQDADANGTMAEWLWQFAEDKEDKNIRETIEIYRMLDAGEGEGEGEGKVATPEPTLDSTPEPTPSPTPAPKAPTPAPLATPTPPTLAAEEENIFRVALVSEFSGDFYGNSKNFIEGFQHFSAPVINSLGGIPIFGAQYKVDVVSYDTQSNASRVPELIDAAARGLDANGNAVGDVHAIVAGTGKMNKAIFGPAEAAGLVNIHTSGGNPTMWLETNTYAYGLHLPFIWYTRGPIKIAAARGAKTIAIIRSLAHGFSKASCIAALQWAADAGLTVVGPSVTWCERHGHQSGCQVVEQRCVCGSQADVDAFGLGYKINDTPNFYQLDENLIGNGLAWRVVDKNTTDFVRDMFQDMRNQSVMPDVVLNFATEWHNVLKAMLLEDVTPQVVFGWHGGTTSTWALPEVDSDVSPALTAVQGYWAIGFGQWHKAMNFQDPVFTTNANASQLFQRLRGRELDYDTAGAVTAGVVYYTALSRYVNKDFGSLSLQEKRDAVRQAVADMNDETMWGTLLFNSNHQNIGRSTAAWQIIPDQTNDPQQLCVLPVEAAEVVLTIPFPTWDSRTGCPPGRYNSGSACELCQLGRSNNVTTQGLTTTTCAFCPPGRGTPPPGFGHTTCAPCPPGRSQDGDRDLGVCRECNKGYYQNKEGSTTCMSCPLGSYTDVKGQPNCTACHPGEFQNRLGQSACSPCAKGSFASAAGVPKCTFCPLGRYAPNTSMTVCTGCPAGFTTGTVASEDSSQCVCPKGKYRVVGMSYCDMCKDGMTCPLGSDAANFGTSKPHPLLKRGYWSAVEEPLSVFQCEDESRCLGGKPQTCASELEGRSCAHCKDDYQWTGETCVFCSDVETSKFLYPVLPCILFVAVVTIMYIVYSDTMPKWSSYGNSFATVSYLALSHYQVIDMIGSTMSTPDAPAVIGSTLGFWGWTNDFAKILSPECAGFSGFSARLIGQALVPVVLLVITLILFGISQLLAFLTQNERLRMEPNRLFNVFMSLLFTFFNAIASLSLSLFKCLDNPNNEKTLAADFSMICGDDDWVANLVVAIFATLVYVVSFCGVLIWVILTAKAKIHQTGFQMRWKFLFIKFRLDIWWWALTYLAKGFLYNMGFVLFLQPFEQLQWLLFLTIIYAAALSMNLPYRHRLTAVVDGFTCISIIYCSSLKMWFAPRLKGEMDDAIATVCAICSFSPILVGGVVALSMVYLRTIGRSWLNNEIQRQSDAFSKCMAELSNTDMEVLEGIFSSITEIDRWYIMQTVNLIEGTRNLGLIGHESRDSWEQKGVVFLQAGAVPIGSSKDHQQADKNGQQKNEQIYENDGQHGQFTEKERLPDTSAQPVIFHDTIGSNARAKGTPQTGFYEELAAAGCAWPWELHYETHGIPAASPIAQAQLKM